MQRFIHYAIKGGEKQFKAWEEEGTLNTEVNEAVKWGRVTPGKSSDDIEDLETSRLVLDSHTGNFRVRPTDEAKFWFRPHHPCPDCKGTLELRKKFFKIGSPSSPWKYLCSMHQDGCKSVFPANKGGNLSGEPANAEVRNARKVTNEMFQRLWEEAPDIVAWTGSPSQMKAVINKAKARAYRFLAAKMKEAGIEEGNIQKMDIPQLRIAYKICRDTDPAEVMKT